MRRFASQLIHSFTTAVLIYYLQKSTLIVLRSTASGTRWQTIL